MGADTSEDLAGILRVVALGEVLSGSSPESVLCDVIGPWEVTLSCGRFPKAHRAKIKKLGVAVSSIWWHLTLRRQPRGQSSSDEDLELARAIIKTAHPEAKEPLLLDGRDALYTTFPSWEYSSSWVEEHK